MKASELIKRLQALVEEYGDLDVRYDAYEGGVYLANHVIEDSNDFIISFD